MMPLKDPEKRRAYHAEYMRERYRTDADYKRSHVAAVRKVSLRRIDEIRATIAKFRSNGCALCPERTLCALTNHHLDPSLKEFNIASAATRKFGRSRLQRELEKCICLCFNCHAKVHAGVKKIPKRLTQGWSNSGSRGS
jgi:hypothetical protein